MRHTLKLTQITLIEEIKKRINKMKLKFLQFYGFNNKSRYIFLWLVLCTAYTAITSNKKWI